MLKYSSSRKSILLSRLRESIAIFNLQYLLKIAKESLHFRDQGQAIPLLLVLGRKGHRLLLYAKLNGAKYRMSFFYEKLLFLELIEVTMKIHMY